MLEHCRPSLRGLDSKECEHGRCHVVVVELLFLPHPVNNHRGLVVRGVEKELPLAIGGASFALVTTEEKLAVEQLDGYHSEDKLKSRNQIRKV